jgi:1,2-diacylglycerol 3-beta-glucosyltransferase
VPVIDLTILNYLVAAVVIYYMALFVHLTIRRALRTKMEDTGYRPFFFIIIPAHNEEAVVAHTIDSLLRQDYDHAAIMVMNDGSQDNTSEIAHEYEGNYAGVIVVDRGPEIAGQGKGAVLNHAFEIIRGLVRVGDPLLEGRCEGDIIIAITDADGQLERHALSSVAPYFADSRVGGLQIGVRIANASTNLLTRMQDVEFVGFSAFVQEARDAFGSVGLGGNGQFTRLSALVSLGYAPWTDCLTEDLDLGLSLVRRGWRIRFCPNAYVAQQAVTSLRLLFRQRTRWVQGHYQCWRHLPLLLRDKSVSLVTRVDLSLYLVLVVFVVLVSTGMVLSFLSTLGLIVVHSHAFDFIPTGVVHNALMLVLSFGPLCVFLLTYQARTGSPMPVRWLPAYAIIFAVYTYTWMVATAWAWMRILTKRGSWAKTARVSSESAV